MKYLYVYIYLFLCIYQEDYTNIQGQAVAYNIPNTSFAHEQVKHMTDVWADARLIQKHFVVCVCDLTDDTSRVYV